MTIAAATGSTETRTCSVCGTSAPHSEHVTSDSRCEPVWLTAAHDAPCELPCLGGGVKPAQIRGDGVHGYKDRCPRCGPLRVLPEVAAEMRQRAQTAMARAEAATPGPLIAVNPRDQAGATVGHTGPTWDASVDGAYPARTSIRTASMTPTPSGHAPGGWPQAERNAAFFAAARDDVPALASDVLRCLDEIGCLTRERNDALKQLDKMRDDRAELAAHEREHDIGTLMNRAASASAHRVDAEAALARCPDRPERVAERLRLKTAVATARANEVTAQDALAAEMDGQKIQRELDEARAKCAAEGHMPEWMSVDPFGDDKDYMCTRCGVCVQEPEDT